MENRIFVIGSLNYDVCLVQKRLPKEGETCFADSVTYCSGGKGANQAVQAAKLGARTYMVGCVGDDQQGAFLRQTIEGYGVCTPYLRQVEGSSGMSVAQSLGKGDVRASVVGGANLRVGKADIDGLVPVLQPGDICVFQLEISIPVVEYAVERVREAGCRVVLNAAPAAPLSPQTLAQVDIFVVNEVEAAFYARREIRSIEDAREAIVALQRGVRGTCIITLGKAGSLICDGRECRFLPAMKVDAIESTGAGDSYIGAVCYSLLRGKDVFEASAFATRCSARTVCKIGGQPAMPCLDEVK